MVNNQPMLFKQALEKGQFDILNPEEKNTLIVQWYFKHMQTYNFTVHKTQTTS